MNRNYPLNRQFNDIGRRSAYGGLTMLSTNMLQLLIMVGATMVLARVLTPSDFGLVAMATLLINLAEPIRLFGLPSAIVHQPRLEQEHLAELFWLNFKLNVLLSLVMCALAPVIAWFFDKESLTTMILILTVGFLIRGTSNIQIGLLQRQMRFGMIALVKLVTLSAGAIFGIAWALWTQSYWALVFQQVVITVSEAALLWLVCGWKPVRLGSGWKKKESLIQAMVAYGRNSTLSSMVNSVGAQTDRILIGRFVGVEQLGLYQNALRWASAPAMQLLQPLRTVAVSGFSRLRHDEKRYRAYARKAFTVVNTLTLFTFVFLCIEAQEFVLLLLGSQWEEAVPLFQILVLAMLFSSTERVSKWIYLSEGETSRGLRWQLYSTAFLIVCMIAGLPWGAMGIAYGFCASKALLSYPTLSYCLKTSPLRDSDFWIATWRPALATLGAVAAVLFLSSRQIPATDLLPLRIVFDALAFAGVFASVWLCLPGGLRITRELLDLLKSKGVKQAPTP